MVTVNLPLSTAVETDFNGKKLADAALANGRLAMSVEPWKIRNFRLE